MQTRDLREDNVEAVAHLFPSCVTEATSEDGSTHRLVDFEALKRLLSVVIGLWSPEGSQSAVPQESPDAVAPSVPVNIHSQPGVAQKVPFWW